MRVTGQPHVPVALSQGEGHTLNMQLGGNQNQSGHFTAEMFSALVANLTTLPKSSSLQSSHNMEHNIQIPTWNAVSNIFLS
jgi:hypothetical protein